MRSNLAAARPTVPTHEGGLGIVGAPLRELERAVSTCLLWENTFYEKGSDIAGRIAALVPKVPPADVAALAIRARHDLKLRHAPLWLIVQLLRNRAQGRLVGDTIAAVVRRPDEAGELLALYWRDGKLPLPKQLKRGLAVAFTRWSAHQLAKWNRDSTVKLRDVLFLVHAKPKDAEQAATWKALVDGTLPVPDTWEVALSRGDDKKATWERLIREDALGYMALLMNLRNMSAAGVDHTLVEAALRSGASGSSMALPFRFVAAAKATPDYAGALSDAMLASLAEAPRLTGLTAVLVDISGSMKAPISAKGTLERWEAAGALAVLLRELGTTRVFTFADQLTEVMNLRGLGLLSAIGRLPSGGTWLGRSLDTLKRSVPGLERVIVVTDEQTHDALPPAWTPHAYLVNVAPYKVGLDTIQGWTRISGWSDQIVTWLRQEESTS